MKLRPKNRVSAFVMTLLAALFALGVGRFAFGAAGSTPAHTKNLTDNHDGTYTISLDVVGDSEKKPNNINVIVIVDTSGSMTQQRMTAAKNAVNSLARSLYAYNTQSDPDTVEMALVRFATSSSVAQQPTSSQSTFTTAVSGLGNQGNGGTNWESALQTAYGVDFGDNDQTFVVFVSDGNPTFRTTQNGWNDWSYQYQQWGSGQETATNIQRCYTTAVDDAQRLATKVTPANFFTIGAFGNVDRMEQLTDDAGSDSSKNYYSASDTAALNQAISDILAKIEMAGIANTEIDDGTTNQVTTTSGEVAELLEVDESSYKYYRSGGTYGSSMQPWADAPKAKLVNGTVEWDLSSVGVLENGVKYTVTFDCYPSQYTYDTIAKLKNGDITYNSLDTNVKKYIVDNGNGNYSLRTNTNASLSWDDTRDDAGQKSDEYINPDPVATAADSLTINKTWEGATADVNSLPLTVLMDGKEFHTATLSADNSWQTSSFISVGIIKNGQALAGAKGHDFSFAELDDTQYHWELDAPTVRPMRIGEDIVMLVKVDADHSAPSGADTYTIDGATYYADTAAGGLTATNRRRSNLNLSKVVTGEDAPADATFPFTLTVNNSKAPEAAPEGDNDHNSDYWVWFSIDSDPSEEGFSPVTDAEVSGEGVVQSGNYWYAPSGTQITVEMKAGWNLRFTNLPSGSTYTFVEGDLADGFAFSKAELTTGTDNTFSGNQTTTGTIQNTGTAYAVTYTNDYEKTNLKITKVWDDAKNQDGKRLTADDLKAKLSLSPEVEGAEPTVKDNGDDTYTITYTGLPRYNNGKEVEYTVTESAIDGYTTTGSPAKDHGTITNKHETEKTSVKITKVWDDADNQDGIRPASVSVQLKAGETAKGDPVTLNAGNSWTHTWEKLDKYANGKEIAYTADEVEVPAGYTKEVTGSAAVGFTVTNKHTPETIEINGAKTWNDADYEGQPGYQRPESITVTLTGTVTIDGATTTVVTETATATADNNWAYGWTNLPKKNQGADITYTVTETPVPAGYTATVEGYNVTNTPVKKEDVIDPVSLEITKTDSVGGGVLEGATFTVVDASGAQVATATTDAEGKAKLTFTTAGTYTMTETAPTGYVADPGTWTIVVEQSGVDKVEYNATDSIWNWFYHLLFGSGTDYAEGKMTVTNPSAETKVTVDKVWDDNNNQDGKRPTELNYTIAGTAGTETVDLSKYDVTATQTVKVADDGSASYTWEKLPTTYNGTAVEYAVTEAAVDDYTTEVGKITGSATEGYKVTVTNKHEIEKTKVTVTKAWNDNDNADKTRPESVSVTLSADGTAVGDAVTLNDANNWTYTWENLDVNAAGKAIAYTVDEANVAGYAKSISEISGDAATGYRYTITNSNVTVDTNTTAFFKKNVTTPNTIKDATFSFSIEAVTEGAPMPTSDKGTASYAAGATGEKAIDFGKITYTAAGEYKYKITETNKPDGWTATPAEPVEVTVTVTGDAATGFTAEVTGGTIENAYGVQPTTASFPVEKILSVAEGLTAPDITGKYTFTLTAADGTPMPEVKSYTNPDKDGGSVTFGKIEYTAAGTYTYTVTETGTVDGITNDSAAEVGKTVTVTVVDNGDGTLTATPSTDETPVSFTNTYEVGQVTASIPVEKTVTVPEGLTGPTDWKYTITAAAVDDAPEAESMTTEVTKASPSASIGEFTFTKPGTYKYTVTESGENDGITNGTASYDIEIVVTDNSDGTLTAVVNGGKAVVFENAYSVEPTTVSFPVEKELVVPEDLTGPTEWSYTIDVDANDGAPEAETMTGTVNQDTTSVTFGEFEFTAPGTYTYTVTESGKIDGVTNDLVSTKPVVVTVVDNGNGTLTATADSTTESPLTFTNTYSVEPTTAKFPVKKIMSVPEGADGPSKWSYTIDVAAGEGAPEADAMTGTVDQDNDTVTFGDFTYTEPGTYTYTVTETGTVAGVTNDTAASTGKTVTVTVVDNGDGTLTATADSTTDKPVSFTNTYAAEGTAVPVATKVAKGFELAADQFSFELKDAEGEVLQTKKNAADGSVTFDEISYTKPGTYTYTINEVVTEGDEIADDTHVCDVTVTVTDNGDGTLEATIDYSNNTFTNTHTDNEKTVESAKAETYVDGELVEAGDTLTYTITYANNTAGEATVTVVDTIPANTTYVEGSASDGGVFADGTITWTIENVPAGGTGSVTFEVTVDDAAAGTTLENTGLVSDGENELSTNSVTTSVPVKDVKEGGESVDGEGVQVGDTLTYEVSFTLTEDATSVVVTDSVPAHTTFVSADNDGVLADGTITWDLGALAAGDYTVSFDVTVDESAVTVDAITNTASINVNNHGEVKTNTVTNTPETGSLEISKTVEVPEGFELDEDKAFTFTVTLKDQNGDPLEREYAYTGDYEGTIKSGGTVTLKHGESITIAGLPALAQYSITEADEDGYTPTSATMEGTIPEGGTGSATAAFVNAYNANPATLKIAAKKNLVVPEGLTGPADWSYDIAVEALGGAPEVETMSGTVNKANPTITFGDFSFTKPGEYQYTVTESGTVPGVTNGTEAYTVRVNVVDNKDGTLTATANYDEENPVVFTNTYGVVPLTVKEPVQVDKWLTGTNLAAGAFEFKIEGVNGDEPLPTNPETSNDAKGIVTFDDITFEEPGEYHYVVSEIDSQNPGYTYDKNTVDVTITVVDNGDGTMSATTTYGEKTEFDNSYEANGEAQFFAKKNLTGRALEDGQFTFELVDADGKVIQTKTNNGSGQVSFDAIAYTQEDLLKAESAATDDSASGAVTTDEGATAEGAADATTTDATTTDDAAVTEATTNESSDDQNEADGAMEPQGAAADAAIDEAVAGAPEDEAAEPEANEAADEAVAEESAPAGAPAAEADAPAAKPGSPEYADSATFTYTIREVNDGAAGYTYDTHEETVTVVVTDDGDGNMTAKVTYDEDGAEFTNAYEAEGEAQFNGTKTVTGIELEEGLFTFELKDADNNVLSTATNAADGSFSFAPVNYYQNADQHDADKGTFTYYITEVNDGRLGYTYDSHQATVTVTVTDNGDGTLATEVVYGDGDAAAFNNPYKPLATSAPIRAKKALEGRSLKAGEFTFELSDANGKVVATATNTASGVVDFGNIAFDEVGTYTFTAVEVEGSDSHITYDTSVKTFTVEVVDVDGQLEATVTCDDETATFENVYTPDQPKKGKKKVPPVVRKLLLPTTGDPMAAGSVMTLSAIGAAALLTGLNRRRKRK